MAKKLKVFVSCVSSEFGLYRMQLKAALSDFCEVLIQEDFIGRDRSIRDGRTLLEALAGCIRTCDAVIHIVGEARGDEPEAAHLLRFSQSEPELSIALKGRAAGVRSRDRRAFHSRSFTQCEAIFAIRLEKECFIYRSRPGATCDGRIQRASADAEDQESHWEEITTGHGQYGCSFDSAEQLVDLARTELIGVRDRLAGRAAVARVFPPARDRRVRALTGRSAILRQLDDLAGAHDGRCQVVMLHGPGGIGKSSVVAHWVDELRRNQRLGKRGSRFPNAFAWSFEGQGQSAAEEAANETDHVTSSGSVEFFNAALDYYLAVGHGTRNEIAPHDRGETLAAAIEKHGGLVILDGVEPFQYLTGAHQGCFRDHELQDLVDRLLHLAAERQSRVQPWTLLITSYWSLPLSNEGNFAAIEIPALDLPDASTLLRSFRLPEAKGKAVSLQAVPGDKSFTDEQIFEEAARFVGCQPLALVLMASFLIENFGGRLRITTHGDTPVVEHLEIRDRSPTRSIAAGEPSPHDRHVELDSGEKHNSRVAARWAKFLGHAESLGETSTERKLRTAMLEVARTMSLFSRRVDSSEVDVLRQSDDAELRCLNAVTRDEDMYVKARDGLVRAGLVLHNSGRALDFRHHLIRTAIAEKFRSDNPTTWNAAQSALFTHYRARANQIKLDGDRESYELRVRALSRATAHGCLTPTRIVEAWTIAFKELRGGEVNRPVYRRLLSRSDDLVLLTNFYRDPWRECREGLRDPFHRGDLFNETGYDLQKLARFSESIGAFRSALDIWSDIVLTRSPGRERLTARLYSIRDRVLLVKSLVNCLCLEEAASIANEARTIADFVLQDRGHDLAGIGDPEKGALVSSARLRGMDAYSALGWVYHLFDRREDAEEMFAEGLRLEDQDAKTAEEAGRPPDIRFQKMFLATSFLIDRVAISQAEARLAPAEQICRQVASRSEEDRRRVADDMAFNVLLRGRLEATRWHPEIIEGDAIADEILVSVGKTLDDASDACWSLDLLDGWIQARLARADLNLRSGDHAASSSVLMRVEQLLATAPMPRFELECNWLRARLLVARVPHGEETLARARLIHEAACAMATRQGYLWPCRQNASLFPAPTPNQGC